MNIFRLTFLVSFAGIMMLVGNEQHSHHTHNHHLETRVKQSATILDSMHTPMMAQKPSHSQNIEIDYLTDMIPHHQGAIDSATLLLPHITNKELKAITQNIIESQTKEIKEFHTLISTNTLSSTNLTQKEYKKYLESTQKAMERMMQGMMSIKPTDNIQKDFTLAMITHHQGAIDTSKILLTYSKDSKTREIAQRIITDQEREIKIMQKLLKEL